MRRSSLPASYGERAGHAEPNRHRLAAAVVGLLRTGMVVGLDAGTTNVEVARRLPLDLELTVVTNSPPAAIAVPETARCRVVLLGGTVDRRWMATIGPDTVAGWGRYRLDLGIVDVCGLDAALGASTTRSTRSPPSGP